MTFIALLRLITEKKKRYLSADKIFARLLTMAGILFLVFIIFHGIKDFREWLNLEGLKEFLLPVSLTFLLLPYIFMLSVYMSYKTQFQLLAKKLPDTALLPYAKRQAFFSFLIDYPNLERWQLRPPFEKVIGRAGLDASINSLKQSLATELDPPHTPAEEGWSPYQAMQFLGPPFKTGLYDPRFEDKWTAESKRLDIGDSFHSNSLTYQIVGLRNVARSLEIHLCLMTPKEAPQAPALLATRITGLFIAATGESMPTKFFEKTGLGMPYKFTHNQTRARLEKVTWKNIKGSYDLIFTLRRNDTKRY